MEVSLCRTEKAHKQLDEEAKLLANRIKLLESEEKRTWKRISETKKKAEQLAKSKLAFLAKHQAKQELQERRRLEIDQLRRENMRSRERRRTEQSQIFESLNSFKRKEADMVRAAKEELERKAKELQFNQRLRSSHQARTIKHNTIRAHKSVERRRFKQPVQLDRSLVAQECEAKAREIADLERAEQELIKRLQFTHSMQENAYGELAEAMRQTH